MITIGEMTALAQELILAERAVKDQETRLSELKEHARVLREESLPMMLLELNVTSFKMDTGQTISCKQDVYASIPAARRDEAFAWLDRHGFGGIIKTQVSVQLPKGSQELAEKCILALGNLGVQPELKEEVHPQTLKAWLREQLEKADNKIDLELFGARPVWVASVK